ncbi:hypothetical protein PYW08_007673 [Mythimna loreyi]|uniref:Uncharacterized protein n=1 Tax=Mythimna loreyi TaxID=667449 RepID=A0ACC2QEW7_9NEOP|nr:hypothetical protein PYW08_007673 [Mythimna loreyi]
MFDVYILLQLAFASALGNVLFHDCGSAYELTAVNIQGCGNFELPCFVTVGDDVEVNLEYYAGFMSQNLDQDVVININHLNLKPGVTPERCGIYDCPVMTTDKVNLLTSVMSVPSRIALNQQGYLTWSIKNEEGRLVLCYKVLVQTQSRFQKLLRQYMKMVSHDNQP